jgi:glycosyltransferase involved in cell wall biosynthesis
VEQKLSVVIITFNEERNIERCLAAAKMVADDIVVLDSFSIDKTEEICRRHNVTFIQAAWKGYGISKNEANLFAKHNYILSIDADEVLSEALTKSIVIEKSKGFRGVYELNRLTNYCGTWIKHGGWYPDKKIRLFSKQNSKWNAEMVHEEIIHNKNEPTKFLHGDLYHYSYYSQDDHWKKAVKYSLLTAEKFYKKGRKTWFLEPLTSAIARFFAMYFIKLGFLDGRAGLVIAWISAKANYVKYASLMQLQKNKID